jgi:hypothetical protein
VICAAGFQGLAGLALAFGHVAFEFLHQSCDHFFQFHILLGLAAADSADDGHGRSCPAKTRRFEGDLWEKR